MNIEVGMGGGGVYIALLNVQTMNTQNTWPKIHIPKYIHPLSGNTPIGVLQSDGPKSS